MTDLTPREEMGVAVRAPASSMVTMSTDEINRLWRIAKLLYDSKMFKNVTQAEQAFAKILLGRDLGITPIQALTGIDLVRGNLQMRAVLLASFVRQHPDYDYKVLEHTEEKCSIEFRRFFDGSWEAMGVSTFTVEDAKKAGLVRPDSAWTTVPRNMVFARAMSNGAKWWCPDVLGGVPVYTEGDFISDAQVVTNESQAPAILPAAVEEVLKRAKALGHRSLADRVTAEWSVKDQPEDFVRDWVERANTELNTLEASRNAHAEAAPEERGTDKVEQ